MKEGIMFTSTNYHAKLWKMTCQNIEDDLKTFKKAIGRGKLLNHNSKDFDFIQIRVPKLELWLNEWSWVFMQMNENYYLLKK